MNTRHILIATLLAGAVAPALADEVTLDAGADGERRIVIRQAAVALAPGQQAALHANDSTSLAGAMLGMASARIVKNAPYSAEAVSESVQRLADGNQIVKQSTAMQYRDSAGRTRTEVRGDDGTPRTITISDPVAGARWILHPARKTATRIGIASGPARMDADAAREAAARARVAAREARARIEQLRKEGRLPEGAHVIVKEVQRDAEAGDVHVQVRIAQPAPAALPAVRAMSAQIAPLIAGAVHDGKWSSRAVTRELGEREIDGVKARGSQRSYEIPAGEIGNRDPIAVSSETWYSPELQVTLQHKRSDPRSGDVVYRLDHVKRDEPAAALFAVPADYTVRDPRAGLAAAPPTR